MNSNPVGVARRGGYRPGARRKQARSWGKRSRSLRIPLSPAELAEAQGAAARDPDGMPLAARISMVVSLTTNHGHTALACFDMCRALRPSVSYLRSLNG